MACAQWVVFDSTKVALSPFHWPGFWGADIECAECVQPGSLRVASVLFADSVVPLATFVADQCYTVVQVWNLKFESTAPCTNPNDRLRLAGRDNAAKTARLGLVLSKLTDSIQLIFILLQLYNMQRKMVMCQEVSPNFMSDLLPKLSFNSGKQIVEENLTVRGP